MLVPCSWSEGRTLSLRCVPCRQGFEAAGILKRSSKRQMFAVIVYSGLNGLPVQVSVVRCRGSVCRMGMHGHVVEAMAAPVKKREFLKPNACPCFPCHPLLRSCLLCFRAFFHMFQIESIYPPTNMEVEHGPERKIAFLFSLFLFFCFHALNDDSFHYGFSGFSSTHWVCFRNAWPLRV